MTTATATESIYVSRLRKYNDDWDSSVQKVNDRTTRWKLFNYKPESLVSYELLSREYFESTVGGFQLVITETKFKTRSVNDLNGVPLQASYAHDSEIGGYSDWTERVCYWATAYRIGLDYDRINEITYASQFTTFFCSCVSNSLDKTTKLATKKLEVYNLLLDSLGDLIPLAGTWANRNQLESPYNISIGDIVWIQAFGRPRQGKVIATTGSRFVVGYVTPSNQYELKYKVVPISQMRIIK